jgi:hypothetical protein
VGSVARNNLAHILDDYSIDLAWNPNADNTVYTLAVSGTTVYAGGDFTTIGNATRNSLAALDTTSNTNNATAWNPEAGAGSVVYTLALSGTTVYAGGDFSSFNAGANPRSNIAAIDAGTGTATTWTPDADNVVNTLAVSGTTIYAGGRVCHYWQRESQFHRRSGRYPGHRQRDWLGS